MPHTDTPAGFLPGGSAEVLSTGQHVTVLSHPWPYRPSIPGLEHAACWMVDVMMHGRRSALACAQLEPTRNVNDSAPVVAWLAGLVGGRNAQRHIR